MPPRISRDESTHEAESYSEVQVVRTETLGEIYISIPPSRLLLFENFSRQSLQPELAPQHRLDLYERALAILGGPLRPQLMNRAGEKQECSGTQTSISKSENFTSSILLINLPVDVLMMVVDHLDWETLVTFRFTNKFLAALVLASNMQAHYNRCRSETAREEEWLVKEGTKRFTSRGISGLMYGESLRAEALMGDMKRMPCYKCLRWFRCPTSRVLEESRRSVFSDMMAKPKDRDGVDRYLTRSRLCFGCGVKKGYYHKGGQFKRFIICVHCGKLGQDLLKPNAQSLSGDNTRKSLWNGMKLRYRYYCKACDDAAQVPNTYAEHAHRHGQTYRYERAMWKKGEACIAKRKSLGREKSEETNTWEVWCPILQRKSICSCWKAEDYWRKHYELYAW